MVKQELRCTKCGCEEFEEKFVSIPYAWGPEIGVIKAHATYLKCKKCGTPHNIKDEA